MDPQILFSEASFAAPKAKPPSTTWSAEVGRPKTPLGAPTQRVGKQKQVLCCWGGVGARPKYREGTDGASDGQHVWGERASNSDIEQSSVRSEGWLIFQRVTQSRPIRQPTRPDLKVRDACGCFALLGEWLAAGREISGNAKKAKVAWLSFEASLLWRRLTGRWALPSVRDKSKEPGG